MKSKLPSPSFSILTGSERRYLERNNNELRTVAVLIFILSACCWKALSQSVRSPISAAYAGVGALSNNNVDVFCFASNQAALAKLNHGSVGIYSEKRFLLNELGFYDAAIALPTRSGNFGFDARYFGFTDYNEMQLGLAYARSLGSKVDLGIQFNYYAVRIAGYGNASSVNFELGTILHLTDNVNAALHVYNPLGSKLGKNGEEKLASIYSFGIGFEPSQNFFFSLELVKEEDKPPNVNAGLQYRILPQLLARGGISTATSSMYFGIGFEWKSMRLDATASYHPELGVSPGIMLLVPLSPKGESEKEAR